MGTANMKLEDLNQVTALGRKLKSLNSAMLVLGNASSVNDEATCTVIRWGTTSIEVSNSVRLVHKLKEAFKEESHDVTQKLLDLGVEVGK